MLNERKLSKLELDTRERIIQSMKKNKHTLVKKYGIDAEKVMYGRATSIAKSQTNNENFSRLKEIIREILKTL